MGRIASSPVLLTALIAACAACSTPNPRPGHPASGATLVPVAGATAAPATPAATASPALPAPVSHRPRAMTAPRPVPYGADCPPDALRLGLGPALSQATQQEALMFTLTNISAEGCDLQGFPGVALLDADGRPLPFQVRWRGDQILTTSPPVPVPHRPGGMAYFGLNKNACVLGSYRAGRYLELIPPNDYQPLPVIKLRYHGMDYCRAPDPGHAVDVTPVEPGPRDIFNRHLTGGSR